MLQVRIVGIACSYASPARSSPRSRPASSHPGPAEAQAPWPNRQIRIVVPFAPGGASDILARLIAKELTERLKQPVIVENKPGAGGTIGADLVAKSPPDGYTLLLADSSVLMTFPALYPNLPYKATDLIPVANVATFGLILIAPANSHFNVARRSHRLGQGAAGQAQHGLAGQRLVEPPDARALQRRRRHEDRPRPVQGGRPGDQRPGRRSGRYDARERRGVEAAARRRQGEGARGHLGASAIRCCRRCRRWPKSGLVGFESIAGQGLFVAAGTPRDIVARLNAEVNAIIKSPELQERWTQMGIDRVEQSPEQFAAWLARESDQWAVLIRTVGIKVE